MHNSFIKNIKKVDFAKGVGDSLINFKTDPEEDDEDSFDDDDEEFIEIIDDDDEDDNDEWYS